MARIHLGKWMEEKDHTIQPLKRKFAQQQDVVTQQVEKMQKLEEYIRIQEEYFADRISESTLQTTVAHKEHQKENERLENADLTKNWAELKVKYEKKKLALLVAEANLLFQQETTNARVSKLRRELAQCEATMGKEKVRLSLKAYKRKSL